MAPSNDGRAHLAGAGRWLREQRTKRGFATAAEFGRALGVDKALVSNYEVGRSEVPEDKAERIAEVLGMDIIRVRRGLGLWVPPDDRTTDEVFDDWEAGLDRINQRLDRRRDERQRRQAQAAVEIPKATAVEILDAMESAIEILREMIENSTPEGD